MRALRFDPYSFKGSWVFQDNFDRYGTELKALNLACTDSSNCCAQLYCFDGSGCSGATVSLAFVAPPSTSTACGSTNKALAAFGTLQPLTKGCVGLSNTSTQSFTLSNPNEQRVSVILTDGDGSLNCGYTWGDGRPYSYYQRVLKSNATSITFSDVPCRSSPCCALISCEADDFGWCIGFSLTQTFFSPSPVSPSPSSSGSLAAGVVAAIVIFVLLAVVAGAVFLGLRKMRKDQQTALVSGAGAPPVQIQMNPVQPCGGMPPHFGQPAPLQPQYVRA